MARRRRTVFTPEEAERVVNLRAEGMGWQDIGRQLSLTVATAEEAYEAGTAQPSTANRLSQIFDTLQDKLLFTISSFGEDEITELSPSQRAILFGIMADKVAPLIKVLGHTLGADHMDRAPTITQLMTAGPEDLKEINELMRRMAGKVDGTATLESVKHDDDS